MCIQPAAPENRLTCWDGPCCAHKASVYQRTDRRPFPHQPVQLLESSVSDWEIHRNPTKGRLQRFGVFRRRMVSARQTSFERLWHQRLIGELMFKLDVELLHLFVQRGAIDSQALGGFLTVPAMSLQRIQNDLALRNR